MTLYPNDIDSYLELTPVSGSDENANAINAIIDATIAVETELGKNPRGIYGSVANRLSILESRVGPGALVYGGSIDLETQVVGTLPGSQVDPVFSTTVIAPSYTLTSSGGPIISTGTGVPSASDPNGSLYLRQDGNISTTVYVRQTGTWTGVGATDTVVLTGTGITIGSNDTHIGCTSGGITITLPASPLTGEYHEIKDSNGNATGSNITISGNGNNIDGSSSVQLTLNYTSLSIRFNGTKWSVV